MTSRTAPYILEGVLTILREGGSITLESAAREAGLTKPGLMYHFPTKSALMFALVDHVVDRWEAELSSRVGNDPTGLPARARISAYLDFALHGVVDVSDLPTLADPRLRERLTERWVERMQAWFAVSDDLDGEERGRLLAVRLIADGTWFDRASGARTLSPRDTDLVENAANQLLRTETSA